jgi:hypothetical protein
MVQTDHHNISLVSKSWRSVAGECVNRGGRRPKLSLRANYIAELKSKVFALDLSNLHQVFEKLAGVPSGRNVFTRMITAKFTTRSDDLKEVITKVGGATKSFTKWFKTSANAFW